MRTGISGLDDVLGGGLPPNRVYLVEGDPGVGKTTLALQYLIEGVKNGERCLYVTLSETTEELRAVAESHGWDLAGIDIHELSTADQLGEDADNTLFHPSEIELAETTQAILARVIELKPHRVVFDSLSELRLLAQAPLRYRRQILALKQFFIGRSCTVLLMDDRTSDSGDPQLQSIVHGVLELENDAPVYGGNRRRLLVRKLRGVSFRSGFHDYRIVEGGIIVTPRLIAAEHHTDFPHELVESGSPALDSLFGGGLDRGTSALFMGPAGSGKSAVATMYAHAAALRGERTAFFCFDEAPRTMLARAKALGMPLEEFIEKGLVHIQQVDPAELTPGEFAAHVREEVAKGAKLIVIDTLNGYMHAMPEAHFLSAQLHELLAYLGQLGVLTILVVAQHGMVGANMNAPIDVSYLADTVLMFRYYEHLGEVRKALSALKRRYGAHENKIRELRFENGIIVGEPLTQLQGVFTGVPSIVKSPERTPS